MQVQSINKQNNQPHFKALYKVPRENINEKVLELVEKYKCARCPSGYLAPRYWYILTPNTKNAEKQFEKAFLENGGKYWKASLTDILNKQICETIFFVRKAFDNGKEEWVVGKAKQGVDLLF